VLANSPIAYKNFFDHHADSPYAKVALHLQSEPKGLPLMQAGHLFKGNSGMNRMPLSGTAKITNLPAHGFNSPANGKIVNLPVGNKGNSFKQADHNIKPTGDNFKNTGNNSGNNDLSNKPKFERRQFNSGKQFNNSQARMGNSMRMGGMGMGGGGMRMMGGGGMHFGGGRGGFGRH
jgi:hypothetical protein